MAGGKMADAQTSGPRVSYASDAVHFFRAWMAAPLRTGAQLPSGRELAKAMAAAVNPDAPGVIVELGSGTGAITQALVERGIAEERLILIEADPQFCALLKRRYPGARVLAGDAYAAPKMLRELDVGPIAAVVSGLPLLTQKPMKRQRLLLGLLRLGMPGSAFVQFTYFYRSPIPIGTHNIESDASPIVWWNLWPARVFTYRRPATALT
jgi:phosphatidylethanolamine/phosphatidyl-N-methylethanolamine N-methyltransferase